MSNPIENSRAFEKRVMEGRGLGDIVVLRGQAMRDLIEHLQTAEEQGAYEMRFAINGGGLKVKINNLTWSVPLGTMEK